MKYSELLVWRKSVTLVVAVYKVTKTFPADEKYGLMAQAQRAAVSIPTNIAEGHGRKSTKAYLNHVSIANGSLMELETLLHIAARLDYIEDEQLVEALKQTGEVGKMLSGLTGSLNPQS